MLIVFLFAFYFFYMLLFKGFYSFVLKIVLQTVFFILFHVKPFIY